MTDANTSVSEITCITMEKYGILSQFVNAGVLCSIIPVWNETSTPELPTIC
jgi:hypothetical protein